MSSLTATEAPPEADEFELSLFGPGIGECAVLHLGDGRWMVVDSCRDRSTGNPVALDYLGKIGVDPEAVVTQVVTHWHDDHIRGASAIAQKAVRAQVVFSAALRIPEFQQILGLSAVMPDAGADEFRRVLDVLKLRSAKPQWALANTCILRLPRATVYALSPSSGDFSRSLEGFRALLPQPRAPKRRSVVLQPNDASVALWVEFDSICALLGSDLERGDQPDCGWQAVVNSSERPPGRAQLVKVPHHGSAGADDPRVWSEMLHPQPTAVLTPFRRSALPLPRDCERLLERTPEVFCTARAVGRSSKGRSATVEKLIRRVATDPKEAVGAMGHVRSRWQRNRADQADLTVELFNGAERLQRISAA